MYLLVIGIAVGFALSQWILGRIAPETYTKLFEGGEAPLRQQLFEMERDAEIQRQALRAAKADSALADFEFEAQRRRKPLVDQIAGQREQRRSQLHRLMMALVLAMAAMMMAETLIAPDAPSRTQRLRGRFASARYALMAMWLALLIAQPFALRDAPVLFTLLLVAVALAASLVPLGKSRTA